MPKTLITRPKFNVNKPISSESVKQTKQKNLTQINSKNSKKNYSRVQDF